MPLDFSSSRFSITSLVRLVQDHSLKDQIMFDEIVNMVKHQLGNNPQVASSLPPEQQDAVHHEVATQITHGLANQSAEQGGIGGVLSQLQNATTSGNPVVNAIEGGVVSSLASKFGLPPMVTGAIAASLPGLLQKFAHKANDPNDQSITPGGLNDMFSKFGGGALGNIFNRH
jgi:uncharacterized protein YidB (DUF937 family)